MSFPKDELEALWAPWRVQYYELEKVSGDFLQEAAQSEDDEKHLVVERRKGSFLVLNGFPYAVGHMMAVPYRKTGVLEELTSDEMCEMMDLAILAQRILRKVVNAHGFNIGFNIGDAAGAGVADHLHMHIVPRWRGDTNFMAVVGGTRILPDALRDVYRKVMEAKKGLG